MNEYNASGVLAHAAMKADVDPKTARKYIQAGQGPQELKKPHTWRTRRDPLRLIWPEAAEWLERTPELEAKTLFEHLVARQTGPTDLAGHVDGGALRTFQRRVTQWRRQHGPAQEVCFARGVYRVRAPVL